MNKRSRKFIFFFLMIAAIAAAPVQAAVGDSSDKLVWREIDDAALQRRSLARLITPAAYRAFSLDKAALDEILNRAPLEFSGTARGGGEVVLSLPMPDGSFRRFQIEKSPIVEEGLAIKFPELRRTFPTSFSTSPISTSPSPPRRRRPQ